MKIELNEEENLNKVNAELYISNNLEIVRSLEKSYTDLAGLDDGKVSANLNDKGSFENLITMRFRIVIQSYDGLFKGVQLAVNSVNLQGIPIERLYLIGENLVFSISLDNIMQNMPVFLSVISAQGEKVRISWDLNSAIVCDKLQLDISDLQDRTLYVQNSVKQSFVNLPVIGWISYYRQNIFY